MSKPNSWFGALFGWNIHFAFLDPLDENLGVLVIHCAPNGHRCPEHLSDGSGKVFRHATGSHLSGDVVNLLKLDVTVVLHVLNFLAVTSGLVEGLDDKGGGRGDNRHLSLAVLDGQFYGHFETLEGGRLLGDITSQLLSRL